MHLSARNLAILAILAVAGSAHAQGSEWSFDGGMNYSQIKFDPTDGLDSSFTDDGFGAHVGLGFLRPFAADSNHWLGMRLEADQVVGDNLLAFRVLDYQYRLQQWPLAVGGFVGTARLDTGAPAFGYYGGLSLLWTDIMPNLSAGVDLRFGDKLARDKVLASDPPPGQRPDVFYELTGGSFYLRWRF